MVDRHWIKVTLLLTCLVTAVLVGINAYVDIFGVFRDPKGRHLKVYGDDRVAKYLLSARYVGTNFDGVLIGSSVTGPLAVGRMKSAHLYNESLDGGNIVEEKALLDQVLGNRRAPPKLVVLTVHPYLTSTHVFETVHVGPAEVVGALGSQNLFDAYKDALRSRVGRGASETGDDGSRDLGSDARKLNSTLRRMFMSEGPFEIDPVAAEQFRATVTALHERGIPLAFYVPPTYEPLLAPKRAAFERFVRAQLEVRGAEDRLLDMSSEEFAWFRRDENNFTDGVHLRTAGAATVTRLLDERIAQWRSEGWAANRDGR